MASTPGSGMELLGRVAYELHQVKPLLPTYIHLLASAIFPIYTAAHASLARPSSAAPAKKQKDLDVTELQDEEISPTIETLTASDAILFPLLAGGTLATLYFILKWLKDPALLNYYLGLYFGVVGFWFAIKFVKDGLATARSYMLPNQYSYKGKVWKLIPGERHFGAVGGVESGVHRTSPLPGRLSILFQHRNAAIWTLREIAYTRFRLKFSAWKLVSVSTIVDTADLVAVIIAAPLVYYHTFIGRPWFLTNILGFSFCYGSLQITTPGTSSTGSLLLAALFFYDIYFVFYTPMMVTVATKLDVPIKLLFPRPDGCIKPVGAGEGSKLMEEYLQCLAKKRTMAMLGLGDIVVPGMMLAFALRFDLFLYYQKQSCTLSKPIDCGAETKSGKPTYLPATGLWGERWWTSSALFPSELQAKRFPKVYFIASTIGYILGMIATIFVMQVYQHAQPALLYLVPGVLGSLWSVALVRGDLKALWNYSEVPEEMSSSDDKKKEENKIDNNTTLDVSESTQDDIKETTGATSESQTSPSDTKDVTQSDAFNDKINANNSITTTERTREDENPNTTNKAKDDHVIYFALTLLHSPKPTATRKQPQPQIEQQLHSSSSTATSEPATSQGSTMTVIERVDTTSTESEEWSSSDADEAASSAESTKRQDEGDEDNSESSTDNEATISAAIPDQNPRSSARIAARRVSPLPGTGERRGRSGYPSTSGPASASQSMAAPAAKRRRQA